MRGVLADLDERDQQILADRQLAYDAIEGPRVGDFVRFADGVERRISYIWRIGAGDGFWVRPADYDRIQTSDSGSYHLGDGYVSMSGGLHPAIPANTLSETDETKPGPCWFFHHDLARAHNGVDVLATFRVFTCSREANH